MTMATIPANSNPRENARQEALQSALDALVRRTRLAVWVGHLSRFTLGASAVNLAALILFRFAPLFPISAVVAVTYALAVLASVVAALRTPISTFAIARYADERLGLKQRLSSALALEAESPSTDSTFLRLQSADAAMVASLLRPEETVPMRGAWRLAVGAAFSVAVVVCLLMFLVRSISVVLQGVPDTAVVQEGSRLARSAQEIESKAATQNLPQTGRYAQELGHLGKQMQSRSVTRAQALNRLTSLSAAVKNEQQALAKQGAAAAGTQGANAGRSASGQSGSESKAGGSHEQENGQTAAGAASMNQALDQAERQVGNSRSLSPAGQRRTAQDLQNLAREASQAGLSQTARDLNAAAQALAQGKASQAEADLRRAAADAQREEQATGQRSSAGAQSGNSAGANKPRGQSSAGRQASGQSTKQASQTTQGNQSQGGQGDQKFQTGGQQSGQGQPGESGNNTSGQQAAASQKEAQGLQSVARSLGQAEQRLSGQQSAGGQTGGQQAGSEAARQPGTGGRQAMAGGNSSASERGGQSESAGGAPSNITQGEGRGGPTAPGHYTPSKISGSGYSTPKSGGGVFRGQPQQIDSYKPQSSRQYARIYLPASGPGRTVSQKGGSLGNGSASRPQASSVPYYKVYPQFKKGAEAAIAKEDIPRAYANKVRQYFQSLAPPGDKAK